MAQPRISFDNRMWLPQRLNAFQAEQSMRETTWTSLIYGFAARGYLPVWTEDEKDRIPLDRLYEDAVSLSLGVLEIDLPHIASCSRLICNCKIM